MRDSDLIVGAYVDGELEPDARSRFEADMAADPTLAERVAAQRRLRKRLSAAYDSILAQPVPVHLTMAAQAANGGGGRRSDFQRWGALAASLLVGVLVGRLAFPQEGPIVSGRGALAARGELARVLDQNVATDIGPIRIGLSFLARDGRYCRTFQSSRDRLAGLACRDNNGWRVRTVTTWAPPVTAYRTAGAEMPPEILASVDGLIAGDAMDAVAEAAARQRGWKAIAVEEANGTSAARGDPR